MSEKKRYKYRVKFKSFIEIEDVIEASTPGKALNMTMKKFMPTINEKVIISYEVTYLDTNEVAGYGEFNVEDFKKGKYK